MTETSVSVCLAAVLKNWSLVLFGSGRRRRSTDNGVGTDIHSWAAVRSTDDRPRPSAAAVRALSSPSIAVIAVLLSVSISSRDAGWVT